MENDTRATVQVQCSTHRQKAYEFLVIYRDGIANIGGKRVARARTTQSPESIAQAKRGETHGLTGKINFVNGANENCLHCDNTETLKCLCGNRACASAHKAFVCPTCGFQIDPKQMKPATQMTGQTVKTQRLGTEARPRLTHRKG